MDTKVGADTRSIAFAELSARRAPLMWGQRAIWTGLLWRGERAYLYNQPLLVRFDPAAESSVLAALGRLLAENEVLRTVFHLDPKEPWQQVLGEGVLELDVRPLGDLPDGADAAGPLADLVRRPFDSSAELPLRVRLFGDGDGGEVSAVGIVAHHLALDGWSLNLLADRLRALVGGSTEPGPEAQQPCDRAEFEASGQGRRIAGRTLAFWDERIRAADPVMIRALPDPTPDQETATLVSARLAEALRTTAARAEVSETAVLLSAAGALLGVLTGARSAAFRVITAPRFRPGTRHLVGAFNQNSLLCTAPNTLPPGDELAATARALMAAYRHCECDPLEQDRRIVEAGAARGVATGGFCFFNDIRFETAYRPPAPAAPTPPAGDRLSRGSAPANYGSMFFLTLEELGPGARLTLAKDPRFVADCDPAAFLRALEESVVLAARSDGSAAPAATTDVHATAASRAAAALALTVREDGTSR
ncbi:condensation domain-containing protein [Streptacidiphilus cavernicola]|uniref:Condensation domain-containing protein n=1 Tax=Streptacidiphilus cavernicola TaxID=3342716 RepID=A0ABV6VSG9_9ACTN